MAEDMKENKQKKNVLVIPDDNESTYWRLIIIAGVVSALNAVENSVLGLGDWPYMKEIDEQATAQFFGLATGLAKGAHAIFALLFSIWSYKIGSVRMPLLASRIIAIIACLMYLSVEYIGDGKRYLMMSVYILLGIANSACTVLRGYITMCSSSKDIPRAFAIMGLSSIVSIVVGLALQLIFSSIPYPGFQVIPGISFHIYSAPIWFSLILTIATFVIIAFFMKDVKRESSDQESTKNAPAFSIQSMRYAIQQFRRSKLDWRLICVCLFVKTAATFSHVAMASVMSILFMVQYGWSGTKTVQIGSILMVSFGVLSCAVLFLYIFARLGERLPQQKLFLACTIASGMVYVVTYPYKFTSRPVAAFNETTHSGCNPEEYNWCDTAYAVNPYFSMAISTLVTAPAITMMHTALDTVYSKILGNIDQNVGQGAMTVVDDVVSMITPIFTTTMFTVYGVGPLWIVNSIVFFAVSLVWAVNIVRIGKHL